MYNSTGKLSFSSNNTIQCFYVKLSFEKRILHLSSTESIRLFPLACTNLFHSSDNKNLNSVLIFLSKISHQNWLLFLLYNAYSCTMSFPSILRTLYLHIKSMCVCLPQNESHVYFLFCSTAKARQMMYMDILDLVRFVSKIHSSWK
eukprot:TRINITY_DN9519_c0_g1_i1.p1 TRINITY_DN9519_c0_g1~~TRINITY_DN9519_c0_g1_i1.p1  ORF type:complete len:146 (-),score=4.62 TRINITY_DN9519_c0_g1_i1:1009-1446(-)